jgi:hypothetical protein
MSLNWFFNRDAGCKTSRRTSHPPSQPAGYFEIDRDFCAVNPDPDISCADHNRGALLSERVEFRILDKHRSQHGGVCEVGGEFHLLQ